MEDSAQELANRYMNQHGLEIPAKLLFEASAGWVYSCQREGGQIGGTFAVLVERGSGAIREFGVGSMWSNVFHRISGSAFLCAEPAARSAALIDRIIERSGATLEDVAGAQALLGAANVLLLGSRDKIEGLKTLLERDGFAVYVKHSLGGDG